MRKIIIGVMGPGSRPAEDDIDAAQKLGKLIAREGWVLLTGGRNEGVMDAASRGAQQGGGITVGILPSADGSDASAHVDIGIITGMGSARNNINILSSHLIIACGSGAGTTSEIMLAVKAGKPVILLNQSPKALEFFREITGDSLYVSDSPAEAIKLAKKLV